MADIERSKIALPSNMTAIKTDIDKGLTDLAKGRVKDFDARRIIERGKKLLAARLPSA